MAVTARTKTFKYALIDFDTATWHDDEYDNWRITDAVSAAFFAIPGFTGVWKNSTAFTIGQLAVDGVDGKVYEVLVAHTSATTPTLFSADRTANPTFWQIWLINHAGDTNNPHSVTPAQIGGQPLDATLTAFAALVGAADKLPFFTGADAFSLATFTAAGRALVDDVNAVAQRVTLGLSTISQAEAEAGTATTARAWTAQRVKQAAVALSDGSLRSRQIFTADDTYTKPAGLVRVIVEVLAGGGAGGGSQGTGVGETACGSGGGAGGYGHELLEAASLGVTETVTVGLGGTGVSGAAGNAGGTSSFGALLSATGGSGGSVVANSAADDAVAGGIGGVGSSGDLNVSGGDGSFGIKLLATISVGGNGGDSHLGGGGRGFAASSTSGVGDAGGNDGGGGGGSAAGASQAATVGGAGDGGIVIVWEYF